MTAVGWRGRGRALWLSLLALGFGACGEGPVTSPAASPPPVSPEAPAAKAVSADGAVIPGPRSCFWRYGPHSADPYINLAYPDASVFYWAATFSIPAGASLRLSGDFAHARYQSFISYDERGRPIESLADYLMKADDGSENPFVIGTSRKVESRSYTVEIANEAPSADRGIGRYDPGSVSNLLHAPAYADGQQVVLYRIYLPDEGKAPDGGVALPAPELTLEDGTTITGQDACDALRTTQVLRVSRDAVGIPPRQYRALISQPDKPDTWPSKLPPEWFIQLDRASLIGIYTGEMNENARRSEGGFYPNLDNQYIRTIINRKHGKVFVVRGKMPTTPRTYSGNDYVGESQLRYWSMCSNQGFANTRVNDCLFDEEIPLDVNGNYTIFVSRAEDRPRNATNTCGFAWLPMAEDGDGMFDEDVTVVQIREMLAAPDHVHAVNRVERQSDLARVMGPYMPQAFYMQPNQVEALFPCGDPRYLDADAR